MDTVLSLLADFIGTQQWLEGEAFSAGLVARQLGISESGAIRELERLERGGVLESETAKGGQYRFWRLSAARVKELGIER